MPTLLVTGGLGFIGSNFIHRYLWKNPTHRVVNIDNHSFAANPQNLSGIDLDHCTTYINDINDQGWIAQILTDHKPYSVVHFAAESHVDRSIQSAHSFYVSNVMGTFNLMEVCEKYHRYLKEKNKHPNFVFIHVSTDEVYGSLHPGQDKFTEKSNYAPNSPYAASKAASDHIARSFFKTHGFPSITTHCSNNYGPRQHTEKFIPTVIRSILEGKKVPVYGDGKNIRDWVYVDDHNDALMEILRFGIPGEVYNIGADCEVSNYELVCAILERMDLSVLGTAEFIKFVEDRPGHDFRYAIDNNKVVREMNWHPKVNLRDGLDLTIEWYKNEYIRNNIISGVKQQAFSSYFSGDETITPGIR